jgi:hypothetical protein
MWSTTETVETRFTITGEQHGGGGGSAFSDLQYVANPLTASVKSIAVRSGSLIDSLQVSTVRFNDESMTNSEKRNSAFTEMTRLAVNMEEMVETLTALT